MQAPSLPSGIVTFVFTDIEGSTRLLHRLGDRYDIMLERHRDILRDSWVEHRGHEISTKADEFVVAFSRADDALRACVEARRGLAGEDWPEEAEVRVRMGVHSGLAWPQDGDYVALAAHQAARVMAAGHGGQILVSEQAAMTLDPVSRQQLRPLGRYRLRDFDEPPRLYEAVGDGPGDRPQTPRAIPAEGHNIVRRRGPMIGRADEVSALTDHIESGRLITLIGPGGVGKTRIATEVGITVATKWDDGVWMVDLAGIAEPEHVPAAIADAIGVPSRPAADRWDDVLDHLESRRAVVILDNCEHLVHSCKELVEALLASCPHVGALATSREPLRVEAEMLWQVDPLPVPAVDKPGVEALLASPAGRLFVELGTAARPGFTADAENAGTIAEICRRLDGLPLLIELAAAHLSAQSPAEILSGLEDRLRLLRGPDRRAPDRHRTAEGLLEWSYRLLGEDEQATLRCLSFFATGFSVATASTAATGVGLDSAEVPHLIWTLVDRSLVQADLGASETRYRLLETVRSYGRRLLDEHGETEDVAVSLATAYLEHLGPWLGTDRRWIGDVGVEIDNLRAVVARLPADQEERAQQLACTIGRWHDSVQTYREGIKELARHVETLRKPTSARVSLVATLAYLHLRTGEIDAAERHLERAEALQREHPAPSWDDVTVDRTRGEIARRAGDLELAVEIAREALERPLSDRGRARMYNLLGTALGGLGDLAAAYEACRQELELTRDTGNEIYAAIAQGNLAETALRLGDLASAARHQRASLELAVGEGYTSMIAFSLIVAARLAGVDGDWATAVRLHARAEAMLDEIGLALYDDDRRQSDELLTAARRALGDEQFVRAESDGRGTDVADAARAADDVLATAEQDK